MSLDTICVDVDTIAQILAAEDDVFHNTEASLDGDICDGQVVRVAKPLPFLPWDAFRGKRAHV